MPESRKEILGGLGASGGTVSLTPATPGIQVTDHGQVAEDTTKVLPEGAYSIEVHNTGLEPITVNGITVEPNDRHLLEAKFNEVTQVKDFCPQTTVVTASSGSAYYVAFYPSL